MVNKVASTQPIVNGRGTFRGHKSTGPAASVFWLHFVFVVLLSSCASNYERGTEALLVNDYATARSEADEGLQDNPDDAQLLGLMARALYGMDEYPSAIRFAELAIASGDLEGRELGEVYAVAGRSYAETHDFLPAALNLASAHTAGVVGNDAGMRQILLDGGLIAVEAQRGADGIRLFTLLYRLNETTQDLRANQRVAPLLQDAAAIRADELMSDNDSEGALQMLAAMIRDFPELAGFELTRGLILLRLGHQAQATSSFEQFVQASSDAGAAWENVAAAVQESQRLELAVELFTRAITFDRRRHAAHAGRLETLLALERREEAQAVSREWIEAVDDPDFLAEAVLRSAAIWWEHDSETGLELLRLGVESVHNFEITHRLASALRRRGRVDEADELIADYIAAGNPPAVAAEEVADWYRSRSRFAVAAEYYNQAIGSTPDPRELLLKLAETYSEAGWAFDMARTLEVYLERTGGERQASVRAVELLTRHALWREVVDVLESLLAESPDDFQLALQLGEALFNSSEPDDEQALYQRLFSGADDPGQMALRFGEVFAERGFYQESLAWFDHAAAQSDTRAEALLAIGVAHRRLGQSEAMWSHFELLLDEAADPIAAGFTILSVLSDRAAAPIAVELIERLITLSPERIDLHRELVMRLAMMGDEAKLVLAGTRWVQLARTLESAEELIWVLRTRPDAAVEVMAGLIDAEPDWASLNLAAGRTHLQLARGALGSPRESARHRAAALLFYERYIATGQYENLELLGAADTLLNHNLHDLATRYYRLALDEGLPPGPIRWPFTVAMAHTQASDEALIDRLGYTWEASDDPLQTALDATDLFADQGRVRPAIAAARLVFRQARLDGERSQVFERVAGLMVDAGSLDELVQMAWEYVDLSRDQAGALQVAASFLIRAGQYDEADEFLELALERTPARSDLALARAEIRLRERRVQEARHIVAELAERSPTPWRHWEEYGHRCAELGDYQESARAYRSAVSSGGDRATLILDQALADLRIGDTERALETLREAATAANRPDTDRVDARAVTRGVVERLLVLGELQHAEEVVSDALGTSNLHGEAELLAAELALASGREMRAQQMIERAFASGENQLAAIRLEVSHGLVLGAREHLRQLVFDGNPATAQTALLEHADWIADDDLDTFGQFDSRLLERLTAARLRAGRLQAGLTGLERLSESDHRYNYALIAVGPSQRGAGVAYRALRRLLSDRELSEADMVRVTQSLATSAAMGNHREIQEVLAVLALDPALPQAAVLEIDWLLASGQGIEAVESYLSISLTSPTFVRDQALAAFVRRGYSAEAAVLARDLSSDPDMALRAIEADLALGRNVEAAVEAYLERYSSQSLLVLALGELLVESNRGTLAADTLTPLLGAVGQHSRSALRALIRASLAGADPAIRDNAVSAFVDSSSLPRQAHIEAAAALSEYGLHAEATERYRAALVYTPYDSSLEIELYRSRFAAGRIAELIESRSPLGAVRTISGAPHAALELAVAGTEEAFFSYFQPHIAAGGNEALGWLTAEVLGQGLSESRLEELLSLAEGDGALQFATMRALGSQSAELRQRLAALIMQTADTLPSQRLAALEGLLEHSPEAEIEAVARGAVEESTDPASTAVRVALVLFSSGLHEEAGSFAEIALVHDERNAAAYAILAGSKLQTGDVGSAAVALEAYLDFVSNPLDLGGSLLSVFLSARESSGSEPLQQALSGVWMLEDGGTATPEGWLRLMQAYSDSGAPADGLAYIEARRPEVRAFPAGLARPAALASLLASAGEASAAEAVLRDDLVYGESTATLYALSALLAENPAQAAEALRLEGQAQALGVQTLWGQLDAAEMPDSVSQQIVRLSILRGVAAAE